VGPIADFLSDSDRIPKLISKSLIAVASILANFAASNDPEVVGFVLSPVSISFLGFVAADKSFQLRREVVKVLCFAAIVLPGETSQILLSEDQDWLSLIIEEIAASDGDLAKHCLECLAVLSEHLAADPPRFGAFIARLREGQLDQHLDFFLDESFDPMIINCATHLLEQL
jgi:hypothetical protein